LKSVITYLLILILFSCGENRNDNTSTPDSTKVKEPVPTAAQLDSIEAHKISKTVDTFPTINYKLIKIKDKKHHREIIDQWGWRQKSKAKRKAFLTLNRKETRYIRIGDTVIVPDTAFYDMKYFSVFPHYFHKARDIDKLIVISNPQQAYACYEKGHLVRFAACNTGKERTPTYPGRYALVWRDRLRKSSLDSTWILPFTFNFHKQAGNAFHQFTMPGYAASHSCVRQFLSDAEWLYNWGRGVRFDSTRKQIPLSGTPVIILDMPDYDRKRGGPWFDLATNKEGIIKLDFKPMEVEEALIPMSQIPKVSRWSLRNRERYLTAEETLRARGIIREHVKLIETRDFNKERREKRRKAHLDSIAKAKIQDEKDKTNMNLIKDNLEKLNSKNQNINDTEVKENSQIEINNSTKKLIDTTKSLKNNKNNNLDSTKKKSNNK